MDSPITHRFRRNARKPSPFLITCIKNRIRYDRNDKVSPSPVTEVSIIQPDSLELLQPPQAPPSLRLALVVGR